MAGRPIGNFPPPLIKRVWHTCCADVGWRRRSSAHDLRHRRASHLQHALAVRDAHQAGEVSAHGLAVARGHLINPLAERLDRPSRVPDVQRFAAHLTREFPAIWSFLFDPTIDATDWRAERAIRLRGNLQRRSRAIVSFVRPIFRGTKPDLSRRNFTIS